MVSTMRLHLLSSLQEGSFYTLFLVLPLFIGGMGAKVWLRVGRIRVYMMREVFEVVGVVGGGDTVCEPGMFGLPFGVFMLSKEPCGNTFWGGCGVYRICVLVWVGTFCCYLGLSCHGCGVKMRCDCCCTMPVVAS